MSYNAGMGSSKGSGARSDSEIQIDHWLRDGGIVIASSERARRFLTANYHRARRSEGLAAWPSPAIEDWHSFLRTCWDSQAGSIDDARLILNAAQEKSIWAGIAASQQQLATMLNGPRNRVARLAQRAYQLLCLYAPRYLRTQTRAGWQQDAATFSEWIVAFEDACAKGMLLSPARLSLELISRFENEPAGAQAIRPPLLLVGFDRILPSQRRLFDAWGKWESAGQSNRAEEIRYYRAPDARSELAACALWCKQKLAKDPDARLLVISQEAALRRGEIERAFSGVDLESRSGPSFEFTLGIPLSKTALARSASLLLEWLSSPITENDVDWLLSSAYGVADGTEATSLQSYMRNLRQRGLERPVWTLSAFLNQSTSATLPANWVRRMTQAHQRVNEQARSRKSPLEWSEFVPNLLKLIGWPGMRALSSEEFQVVRRWEDALESCASLGFDGDRISWEEFLSTLSEVLDDTLFAPETREAPIQITGPAESAGLSADGIWFMGASEDTWPASGATHPLLPIEIQREAAMPHATSKLDWELANAITSRLLGAAHEVCFSFAHQGQDADARPSRLVMLASGSCHDIPTELLAPEPAAPITSEYKDFGHVAFRAAQVEGGSSILTYQSQCPFKAFATARLGARGWNPAEPCLTPAQRGKLLHAVLHSIWGGPKSRGIRTLAELKQIENRDAFVAEHVAQAMQEEIKRPLRERLPRRYLEMEERRLRSLISEWLDFELTRIDFTVLKTEDEKTVQIAGLAFDVRLDRVDRLQDGSLLVIDYKSGSVSPQSWALPRPDDVQLPLYLSYGVREDETAGGLAFATVRRGEDRAFAGNLRDARATLDASLPGTSNLVRKPLGDQAIRNWKQCIETLAQDFLMGRAVVDPREYPKTCERCDLQAVCRVQEHRAATSVEEETTAGEEVADE